MNSGHQPNGIDSGHQPNGITPQPQPNGISSGDQSHGTTSGHLPNGIISRRRPNRIIFRHQPYGITSRHLPNGIDSGHQPNGIGSGHQPNGINSGHQPNGIIPQHQQNGVTSPTRHTLNGISSQHERGGTNLERRQSQSAPRGRAPMPLQPAPMVEDDYPVTAIRVPVSMHEDPHCIDLEIRDCDLPGCGCRVPDLRRFLGEYPIHDTDYQTFRALWNPPGMESLHGTYIMFAIKGPILDNRPPLQLNGHFSAILKGDVFIMKVKESIDERAAFTDPLGYPARTLPHYSGVCDTQYEHIERGLLGSDLFTEMTLATTHPFWRVNNPSSIQLPVPVGFWRAYVQGRVQLHDYQVAPLTPRMDFIMERFLPPHIGNPPPWIGYDVLAP